MPTFTYRIRVFLTRFLITLVLLEPVVSCQNPQPAGKDVGPGSVKEPLIEANKMAVQTETEQINDFLRRYKWKMEQTGSGLHYLVYQNGEGPLAKAGDVVEISYSISLLNGDTVYTSKEKGNLAFIPGRAQVISGLEEGILLLKKGDRAKFIIPSHLAFGLIGDQDKIGQKATLVYDVEVVNVRKTTNLK